MRVLIVRLGAFGDIIHTLPLAADLHRLGARIDWVCDEPWRILLEDNPVIDRCFTVPRKQWKNKINIINGSMFAYLRQLRRQLKARDYDFGIDAQGRAKSTIANCLSGARIRVSHAWPVAQEGSYFFSHRRAPSSAEHIVDKMRALSLPIVGDQHLKGPDVFPLPAWASERAWAGDYCSEHGLQDFWIWNLGGTWPTKLWPLDKQAAFLSLLSDAGHQVVVTWGPGWEEAHAQQLIEQEPRAHMAPPTTLPQLAALIAQSQIFVSGDTGPLHLARALEVPAVGLFGPVPATRNGPRGLGYRNIQAPGALWERKDLTKVHMERISPKQVYRVALEAISEITAKNV